MELSLGALLLLGTLVLPGTWAGSHSMRFLYIAMTQPELEEPQNLFFLYVDDQEGVRLDSDSPSQTLEPQAAWIAWVEPADPKNWEQLMRDWRETVKVSKVALETLRGYFNQRVGGFHTLQFLYGCEVSPELTFQRGFFQLAYDGQDYISLDLETLTWRAAVPQAVKTKRKLEAHGNVAKTCKAFVEDECVPWLKKFLEMGKETLMRTDPPSARVTLHIAPLGEVTLRCRAQDFYPKEISLTWLRDGEEQPQDTEFIETRPAGDGTFQKWAAVHMTSGQEDKYTCRVQHEGLSEPLTLKWEPQSSSTWLILGTIAAGLLLLTAVIVGVGIWRKKHSGRQPAVRISGFGSEPSCTCDSALTSGVSV